VRYQRTLARPCQVSGFGYWSGRDVTVQLRPAAAGTGLVFVRHDLDRPRRIPADVKHRIEVPRRTTLAADGAQVEMVEHVLAALYGLGIDNCEIWTSSGELPGLDGSCQPMVAAVLQAGVAELAVPRKRLVVSDITRVGNEESWVEARPAAGGFSVRYKLDYGPNNAIGRQAIDIAVTPHEFMAELAPARTFILKEEADWLRSRGMGTRVTSQDLVVIGPDGPEGTTFRFENECVRHKALDLVGDLALAGCDLVGQFIAYKSGHRLNAELVKALLLGGQIEHGLRKTA
jgi:UDP-3-O-[3-hydroxymyristoyl] N-acetylglucosamine deacetylase